MRVVRVMCFLGTVGNDYFLSSSPVSAIEVSFQEVKIKQICSFDILQIVNQDGKTKNYQ